MKTILLVFGLVFLSAFTTLENTNGKILDSAITETPVASLSLLNDTKEKVSIYTGSGFVSLNKGSKTSITCNTKKEVRWANKGKKGDVIFKITNEMCGKTIKLSKFL